MCVQTITVFCKGVGEARARAMSHEMVQNFEPEDHLIS